MENTYDEGGKKLPHVISCQLTFSVKYKTSVLRNVKSVVLMQRCGLESKKLPQDIVVYKQDMSKNQAGKAHISVRFFFAFSDAKRRRKEITFVTTVIRPVWLNI